MRDPVHRGCDTQETKKKQRRNKEETKKKQRREKEKKGEKGEGTTKERKEKSVESEQVGDRSRYRGVSFSRIVYLFLH